MADDLGIRIDDFEPLARRVCALDGRYQWGDGVEPNSSHWSSEEPNECSPVDPERNPSKWPTNTDWRTPGFMPWGRRAGLPMAAGFEGTFHVLPGSIWPEPSDDGKRVRLYPTTSPDNPARQLEFEVEGLSGGRVYAQCDYVQFADRTPDEPSGSLICRSRATIGARENRRDFQGRREVFTTYKQYRGPNEWFGPLVVEQLSEVTNADGQCGQCEEVTFDLALPSLGFGGPREGSADVAQMNGAVIPFSSGGVGSCTWFREFFGEPFENPVLSECPAGPETLAVTWSVEIFISNLLFIAAIRIRYGVGGPPVVDPGCTLNYGENCARELSGYYGGSYPEDDCPPPWLVEYGATWPGHDDCAELFDGFEGRVFTRNFSEGFPWARPGPQTLTLQPRP